MDEQIKKNKMVKIRGPSSQLAFFCKKKQAGNLDKKNISCLINK